jgi:hypothetical protein
VDAAARDSLEIPLQRRVAVEARGLVKGDERVDAARGAGLVTRHGAGERQRLYAEPAPHLREIPG